MKEFYRINMATEMCCVVGTTYCMEEDDLRDYARQQGWTLQEVAVPDYVYDADGNLRDDLPVW